MMWNPRQIKPTRQFIYLPYQSTIQLHSDHSFWRTKRIMLSDLHFKPKSLRIKHNLKFLKQTIDYTLTQDNVIIFHRPQFKFNDRLEISYQYIDSEPIQEVIPINSPQGPYYLLYGNLRSTFSVYLDGFKAEEYIDYIIDYKTEKNLNVRSLNGVETCINYCPVIVGSVRACLNIK